MAKTELTAAQIVTLRVSGKVDDRVSYQVIDGDNISQADHQGNHPLGYSDYLNLTIDVATGLIVDWDAERIRRTILEQVNRD